jgi:pimeloyl-ACP methyl ester carboxylesterase
MGYGRSAVPTAFYGIDDEVAHLTDQLARRNVETFHLVAHSFGALVGLHWRRALGARVTGITLVDPVAVSVLRDGGEGEALVEMEEQHRRFTELSADRSAAARYFVDHWNGAGTFDAMAKPGRVAVTSLVPKLQLEMTAARADTATIAQLTERAPPASILIGERTLLPPCAVARQLGPALGAPTTVVAGAGHMIPITHPAAVADAVRRDMDRAASEMRS